MVGMVDPFTDRDAARSIRVQIRFKEQGGAIPRTSQKKRNFRVAKDRADERKREATAREEEDKEKGDGGRGTSGTLKERLPHSGDGLLSRG